MIAALGLFVPQITSRYGTEANKAAVDFNVYGPTGNSVHKEDAVSETEIAGKPHTSAG